MREIYLIRFPALYSNANEIAAGRSYSRRSHIIELHFFGRLMRDQFDFIYPYLRIKLWLRKKLDENNDT